MHPDVETAVKKHPAACGRAWMAALVAAFALAGCAGEAYTASPGESGQARPGLPRGRRGDAPGDEPRRPHGVRRHDARLVRRDLVHAARSGGPLHGEAQLDYLRAKALGCRRAADAYRLTGKERWTALMRCLVIVRKH